MSLRQKVQGAFLLLTVLTMSIGVPLITSGQVTEMELPSPSSQQGCGSSSLPSLTALFGTEKGTFDVYARLGKSHQTGKASLYLQNFQSGKCLKIGSSNKLTGDKWQKLGTWKSAGQESGGTFSFSSNAIKGLPDANRPTVMFVNRRNPVCKPDKECYVNIDGNKGKVLAYGSLLNEDTLHVVKVTDPKLDTIETVDYYVDFRPAYSKSTVEPFDLHYVGGGKHTLNTVITYKSHQRVVISKKIDRGLADSVTYLFYNIVYGQQLIIKIAVSVLSLSLISWLTLTIARAIYKRRVWQERHFLNTPAQPLATIPGQPAAQTQVSSPWHFLHPESSSKKITKFIGFFLMVGGGALTLIIVVNTFFLQLYQVDGPSMQDTLHTGQNLAVNKLGKTWTTITRKRYLPKRGEVIVFSKETNQMFAPVEGLEKNYVVKRVAGLPGERIVVKKGKVKVLNKDNPKGFDVDANKNWSSQIHVSEIDDIDITLGPEEIFVVGDNRPESVDSRANGPIKLEQVIGNVSFRLGPFTLGRNL